MQSGAILLLDRQSKMISAVGAAQSRGLSQPAPLEGIVNIRIEMMPFPDASQILPLPITDTIRLDRLPAVPSSGHSVDDQ